MSENITLARPYAEAAFQLAQDSKALKQWSEMLALSAAVAADPRVARLAVDPRVARERFTQLFLDICGKALSKEGANFIRVLQDNRRIALLPEIAQLFEARRAEAEGRIEAQVVSAFAITPEQTGKIATALKKKFGREVSVTTSVDAALIGGMIIRAGDVVIDGSVRGKLLALASHLNR
jgi:F-type H+-transporting ATPase subunit delta